MARMYLGSTWERSLTTNILISLSHYCLTYLPFSALTGTFDIQNNNGTNKWNGGYGLSPPLFPLAPSRRSRYGYSTVSSWFLWMSLAKIPRGNPWVDGRVLWVAVGVTAEKYSVLDRSLGSLGLYPLVLCLFGFIFSLDKVHSCSSWFCSCVTATWQTDDPSLSGAIPREGLGSGGC